MAIRHPGFYFRPTNEHLFFHYLLWRLNQEPLPDPNIVRNCDVYGGDPWKIFGKDMDKKFDVFTMLKKKNKLRVDRTAGSGTWKGKRSEEIRDSQGKLVGYKKLFTFKSKASLSAKADKTENGHWITYEYSTHPHNETECVLCVIRNKYAEKVKKNGCCNLHGGVQLEEENRRAKKAAHPLHYDHANAVDDPSTALSLSTPAAAQARPATSPAFNEDAVPDPPPTVTPIVTWTVPQNISGDANYVNSLPTTMTAVQQDTCGVGSLAFGGTACLNPTTAVAVQGNIFYTADSQAFRSNGNTNLLPTAPANMQRDTWNAARRAFGGPIADGLPTTSTAAQWVDCKWAHQLMNTEIDPTVQYIVHTVVEQRARALHARNDPVESHPEGVPADWPDEFLDFSHCI